MFTQFLDAAIPEPVNCLGVRLRPFSLGHYFLLSRFCPTFLDDDGTPGFSDLLTAVLICSSKYRDALDLFSGQVPEAEKRIAQWGKKLRKDKSFNFAKSFNFFRIYLNRGRNFPTVKAEVKAGGGPGNFGMWPAVTLVTCMSRLNQSFDEAMDQPLSLSRWMIAQWAETEGTLELVDAKELAEAQAESDEYARQVMEEMKGGRYGRT